MTTTWLVPPIWWGMIDEKKTNNISLTTGAGHIDEQATHHHECRRRRSRRLPIYCISGATRFERGEALIQGEHWWEANNLRLEGYRQDLIKWPDPGSTMGTRR